MEPSGIKAFFIAIGQMFRFMSFRQEQKNAPEMKARETAQTDQELKDSAVKAVDANDVDEIRRRISG